MNIKKGHSYINIWIVCLVFVVLLVVEVPPSCVGLPLAGEKGLPLAEGGEPGLHRAPGQLQPHVVEGGGHQLLLHLTAKWVT